MPIKYKYIFITGSGRCGTSLVRNLIDSHSCIEVIPDEATDLLGGVLEANGYGSVFTLSGSILDALTHGVVRAYLGTDAETKVEQNFSKFVSQNNEREMSLPEFLDGFVEEVVKSEKRFVLIDITSPQIKGLLEYFPGAKILHMIRHPLNNINSEYRFRHYDANSFGGGFPGGWEFSKAFERINLSFLQARQYREHPQVKIIKLEDLQRESEKVLTQIFNFIGVDIESINWHQTRYGKNEVGVSTHTRKKEIFQQPDDWSCLTDNDLFYASSIEVSREFYEMEKYAWRKNSYFIFIKRQLGFVGKNRKKIRSFSMLFKVLILSLAQYIQDVRDKHYLKAKIKIPQFNDYPTL